MRRTLVAALVSCAGEEARTRLRRFLVGLSADELEFLAEFHGARILEQAEAQSVPAWRPADYRWVSSGPPDLDHKMIVLREYLARCDC